MASLNPSFAADLRPRWRSHPPGRIADEPAAHHLCTPTSLGHSANRQVVMKAIAHQVFEKGPHAQSLAFNTCARTSPRPTVLVPDLTLH